jgi:hypothetical protein
VEAGDFTPAQAAVIRDKVRPILVYLRRLVQRMQKRRFPPDDRFLRTTLAAYDAIHEPHVEVHYLSCTSGVRRLPDSCGNQDGQDRDRCSRD